MAHFSYALNVLSVTQPTGSSINIQPVALPDYFFIHHTREDWIGLSRV